MENTPLYNEISAADIFGSESVLALAELSPQMYDPAILGGWYQGLSLCVAFIFLICAAKYLRFMVNSLLSAAGVKLSSRATVHINPVFFSVHNNGFRKIALQVCKKFRVFI